MDIERDRCIRLGWAPPQLTPEAVANCWPYEQRASCEWTPKEDFDALDALTSGVLIEDLAVRHRRTARAIALRLQKGLIEAGATRWMEQS
jgi:hypothetical protein